MMKFLLLAVLVVVVYLLWRNARIRDRRDTQAPAAPPAHADSPQEMVSCPVCGLHLPKPDAVAGADGLFYCSNEHRLRAGG